MIMIIARGWNFPLHARNKLCDECGDRAVEGMDIPVNQLIYRTLSVAVVLSARENKRSNPIEKYPHLCISVHGKEGKGNGLPRLKRKAMDRRPSSRLVFFPHPSAKGTA